MVIRRYCWPFCFRTSIQKLQSQGGGDRHSGGGTLSVKQLRSRFGHSGLATQDYNSFTHFLVSFSVMNLRLNYANSPSSIGKSIHLFTKGMVLLAGHIFFEDFTAKAGIAIISWGNQSPALLTGHLFLW